MYGQGEGIYLGQANCSYCEKWDVQLPKKLQAGECLTSFIALLFYRLQMHQTAELFHAVDRRLDFFLAQT